MSYLEVRKYWGWVEIEQGRRKRNANGKITIKNKLYKNVL